MAKLIINVSTRTEGSHKYFVVENPSSHTTTDIDFFQVPPALGEMGVQLANEFELALAKLAKLPAPHSNYQFVLSDDACALRETVFEISELVFGDNISEEAWDKASAEN